MLPNILLFLPVTALLILFFETFVPPCFILSIITMTRKVRITVNSAAKIFTVKQSNSNSLSYLPLTISARNGSHKVIPNV